MAAPILPGVIDDHQTALAFYTTTLSLDHLGCSESSCQVRGYYVDTGQCTLGPCAPQSLVDTLPQLITIGQLVDRPVIG